MKILAYPSPEAEAKIAAVGDRGLSYTPEDAAKVSEILADVKARGDAAVVEYTRRFDAPDFQAANLEVPKAEIAAARKLVDDRFLAALDRSVSQVTEFHRRQLRNSWITTPRPGVMLGQLVNPVDAAGVYVPGAKGGTTPLVSSVLMGIIPAKIAGVRHIAMTTPPTRDGSVNPYLLVAADTVGADVVYRAGSAWAVAALAFGTETLRKVDVIVGPGNIYVTLAKKLVSGTVGIDMVAGPSEILVVADETADPEFIAADLLSQAEHDAMASSLLITPSKALAEKALAAVNRQLGHLARQDIARRSLDRFGGILITPDLETAVELANRIAPEHMELQVKDPFAWIGAIRNAGALFIGEYTPEPIGDYVAGPNHVLPTGGTARFSSALSVDTFLKHTSLIHYSKAAFAREADDVMRLAEAEGLGAHAGSVAVRCK